MLGLPARLACPAATEGQEAIARHMAATLPVLWVKEVARAGAGGGARRKECGAWSVLGCALPGPASALERPPCHEPSLGSPPRRLTTLANARGRLGEPAGHDSELGCDWHGGSPPGWKWSGREYPSLRRKNDGGPEGALFREILRGDVTGKCGTRPDAVRSLQRRPGNSRVRRSHRPAR